MAETEPGIRTSAHASISAGSSQRSYSTSRGAVAKVLGEHLRFVPPPLLVQYAPRMLLRFVGFLLAFVPLALQLGLFHAWLLNSASRRQ